MIRPQQFITRAIAGAFGSLRCLASWQIAAIDRLRRFHPSLVKSPANQLPPKSHGQATFNATLETPPSPDELQSLPIQHWTNRLRRQRRCYGW
jgi:hypothetical protein